MTISQDIYNQAKEILTAAENVLLIINNRASLDTHLAMSAMYQHLQSKGKNVTVRTNGELILKHKQFLDSVEISDENEILPQSYIVTIDHAGGEIEKVRYDDKDGKFRLYLTPSPQAKPFDFDKVSYSQGGGEFDVIVTFGTRSLRWLNDIYEKNEELFEKASIININNLPGTQEYGTVKLVDTETSVSQMVYDLIAGTSSSSSESVSNLLLMGLLDHLQPLQGGDYKISTIETIVELVKTGADIKECMSKLYFEKTVENFEVIRRVMNNLKLDSEAGIVWSSVSAFDMSQCGVTRDEFILDGRILFNVCKDFSVAFVMYEVEENEIVIEFESNRDELDAKDLLSGYKVSGNSARVFFTVRNKTLADVENEILEMITPKLGVSQVTPSEIREKKTSLIKEKTASDGKILTPEGPNIDKGREIQPQTSPEVSDTQDSDVDDDTGLVTPPPISPESQ